MSFGRILRYNQNLLFSWTIHTLHLIQFSLLLIESFWSILFSLFFTAAQFSLSVPYSYPSDKPFSPLFSLPPLLSSLVDSQFNKILSYHIIRSYYRLYYITISLDFTEESIFFLLFEAVYLLMEMSFWGEIFKLFNLIKNKKIKLINNWRLNVFKI